MEAGGSQHTPAPYHVYSTPVSGFLINKLHITSAQLLPQPPTFLPFWRGEKKRGEKKSTDLLNCGGEIQAQLNDSVLCR